MRAERLLLNRDFQLLWIGETLSDIGSQSAAIAYPLLVLALDGSPTEAGVVGLAKWLPLALFSLPAGVLADRFNRKHLMVFCDVMRLIGALSIVLALVVGRPAFVQILAVSFIEGALFATAHIAERGALAQVVSREQLQDAVARNEARSYAASLVGPSLGGVLFAIARMVPFIADAASYLCSTVAVISTRVDFQLPSQEPRRPWREVRAELREALQWYREQPFYRTTSMLFAAGNPMFLGMFLLILLLAREHHATASQIGVMFTISSAGGLIGALLVGPLSRRLRPRTLLIGGPWLALAVLLLLLVVHNPLLMGAVAAGAEFLAPAVNAVVAGSRIAVAPDALQGRVQAIATTSSMSLTWLGPLAVGFLFDRLGGGGTTLAVAGWALALALVSTSAPSIRHHLPEPAQGR